jgi:hypothetical protein
MDHFLSSPLEEVLQLSAPEGGAPRPRDAVDALGQLAAAARAHVPAYQAFAAGAGAIPFTTKVRACARGRRSPSRRGLRASSRTAPPLKTAGQLLPRAPPVPALLGRHPVHRRLCALFERLLGGAHPLGALRGRRGRGGGAVRAGAEGRWRGGSAVQNGSGSRCANQARAGPCCKRPAPVSLALDRCRFDPARGRLWAGGAQPCEPRHPTAQKCARQVLADSFGCRERSSLCVVAFPLGSW